MYITFVRLSDGVFLCPSFSGESTVLDACSVGTLLTFICAQSQPLIS